LQAESDNESEMLRLLFTSVAVKKVNAMVLSNKKSRAVFGKIDLKYLMPTLTLIEKGLDWKTFPY
jgi:hypothetical protein